MRRWGLIRPAFLAVLALVLIVGGCLAIGSAVDGNGTSSTYSQSPTTGPPGPPVAGPAPQPRPTTPTWTGDLRLTASGINLAVQPPTVDTDHAYATTITYQPSTQTLQTFATTAVWSASTDPTYDQCVAQLQTQPLSTEETGALGYRRGQGVCVVAYGRAAVAFIRETGAPGPEAVEVHALRWPVTGS